MMKWEKLLLSKPQEEREKEPEKWADYPISEFEKDYKSIISSAAFRRLQDKTQVFPLDKSDFVRTRLTHSIEVSTLAKQLGTMVTQNTKGYLKDDFDVKADMDPEERKKKMKIVSSIPEVLSCAGLLHDLGNPPFGHFGEIVIRDWFVNECRKDSFEYKGKKIRDFLSERCLKDLCNFEGNAQALRILSKIRHEPEGYDINLSYAVINTLVKYPVDSEHIESESKDIRKHKLGYFQAEEKMFRNICSDTGTEMEDGSYARHPLTFLLEAADDIAYATSDLEDALKKNMFTADQFVGYFEKCIEKLPAGKEKNKTKELLGNLKERLNGIAVRSREKELIAFQKWAVYARGWLMYVVAYSFSKNYDAIMNGTYDKDMFEEGFHKYSISILKGAMGEFVFDSPGILKLELSAQKIITGLMDDFIYAVLYWGEEDEDHKLTKSQKKFINIISENYKNDYLNCRGEDEAENLYLRFLMVTDFISGMTDSYAKNLYRELNGID